MVRVRVKCPHCGKSLMDEEHKLNGNPCVTVIIEFENTRGWAHLSSFYGNYTTEYEFSRASGIVAKFFCPHCNSELSSTNICHKCGAPMVWFDFLEGYGRVQICSRRGCKHHLIEFEDIENELHEFFNIYGRD